MSVVKFLVNFDMLISTDNFQDMDMDMVINMYTDTDLNTPMDSVVMVTDVDTNTDAETG